MDRKLAAILAADAAGFSRLSALNEEGAVRALEEGRSHIAVLVKEYGGRIFGSAGDGLVAEFPSAVQAVRCSVEIQRSLSRRISEMPDECPLEFRIGVNLGDVVVAGDDLLGHGVNVASRLQEIAAPSGICVSGSIREHLDGKVPFRLSCLGERSLKNIPLPISVYRVDWQAEEPPKKGLSAGPAHIADGPSLAILPFTNLSADPEQALFADGLVDDIINTLSKLPGARVAARNSSFAYKGRAVDVRQIARELDVRYVMEGSLQKSGSRIRITVQLNDAERGGSIWSERYDRKNTDIFAVQDDITLRLATEMVVLFSGREWERITYTTTSNIEAWTYYVKGRTALHWHDRRIKPAEGDALALEYWEKALELDPNSAPLHAAIAILHAYAARFRYSSDPAGSLAKAAVHADQAVMLDANNALAVAVSALLGLMERRFEEASALARKAIVLAPGHPVIATVAGDVLTATGSAAEAAAEIDKTLRFNPYYPPKWRWFLGNAYRLAGRTEEAIAALEEYAARVPLGRQTELVLAYERGGRHQEARDAASRFLTANPGFTICKWIETQFRSDAAELEADITALRAAGLPD